MSLFFLPLLPLAIPYVLGGLEYLRSQLFPSSPPTQPVSEPYTPPFEGGQCPVDYFVSWRYFAGDTFIGGGVNDAIVRGSIQGFEYRLQGNTLNSWLISNNGNTEFNAGNAGGNGNTIWRARITALRRVDSQPDNCGNLGNPNPAPPISGDGIADSTSPNLDNDALKIVEGAPLVTLPNFSAALTAALAAAKAAVNALDGIRAIADALDLLKPLLDKINEDAEDKDKDGKKDVYRYQFGSIRKDGFLRLYPTSESNSYKAEQLDINLLSIPLYYGKYFGENSPNFYRFKSLGYIAFVSPTFGIIEYKEIEFSRMSLKVPDDCIGFFYHLGLENDIVANVWGYYTQPQLSE